MQPGKSIWRLEQEKPLAETSSPRYFLIMYNLVHAKCEAVHSRLILKLPLQSIHILFSGKPDGKWSTVIPASASIFAPKYQRPRSPAWVLKLFNLKKDILLNLIALTYIISRFIIHIIL